MTENLYTPNSIRTHNGRYINLLDPKPEDIMPFDIAVGLARLCRFGGHTKRFYSVAEHSIWCVEDAINVYPELAFKILLHDAHEAYLGDVTSPLKKLLTDYENIANKFQNIIHVRFGIRVTPDEQELISAVDKKALEWEFENKVLNWRGLQLDERSSADLFINHFVKLCKHPHVLQ